jgi:hypothetical protein
MSWPRSLTRHDASRDTDKSRDEEESATRTENWRARPYGYAIADDGVTLLPHEGEQATIRQARTLYETGLSLRAVAAELAARGFVARTSKVFHAQQVRRMIYAKDNTHRANGGC